MYYASCSIPKTNSVKCWIQPCPIAATLFFANVARTSKCKFWRMHSFLRSEKTHRETNQSIPAFCLPTRNRMAQAGWTGQKKHSPTCGFASNPRARTARKQQSQSYNTNVKTTVIKLLDCTNHGRECAMNYEC